MQSHYDEIIEIWFPDESTLEVSRREWTWKFPLDICARQCLIDRAERMEQNRIGSFWWVGHDARDRACDEYIECWNAVAAWEYKHIISRALDVARNSKTVILHEGLQGLGVRRALDLAVREQKMSATDAARVMPVAWWGGRGVLRLADLLAAGRLPKVSPEAITILLLPPPRGIADVLADHVARYGRDDLQQVWEELHGAALAEAYTRALIDDLHRVASDQGALVIEYGTIEDFVDALTRERDSVDHTLVIIGHQDNDGVSCADGPISLSDLATRLATVPMSTQTLGSVDLAICGASLTGNLAALIQASGVPVVTCRGRYAYYARSVALWIRAFEVLSRIGSCDLYSLHTAALISMNLDGVVSGV